MTQCGPDLRHRFEKGEMVQLAKATGVTPACINNIMRGSKWAGKFLARRIQRKSHGKVMAWEICLKIKQPKQSNSVPESAAFEPDTWR